LCRGLRLAGRKAVVAGIVQAGVEEDMVGLAVVGAGEGIAGVVAGGIAEAVAAAGVEEDGFAQVDEACGRGAHVVLLSFFAELFLVAFECSLD
jgi:hypothetical protein